MRRLVVTLSLATLALLAPRPGHATEDAPLDSPPIDDPPLDEPLPARKPPSTLSWGMGAYEKFDPPAWSRQEHWTFLFRTWLAPTYARLPAEGLALAGASFAAGVDNQVPNADKLLRFFYGSAVGLEARLHALRSFDGAPRSWLVAGGLALTAYIVESRPRLFRRVRFPSLAGVILPEAGVAARSPQPTSFYLRWSFPIGVLVEKHVAIELVPAALLLYSGTSGGVDTLWSIGLGFSWRQMGRPALYL